MQAQSPSSSRRTPLPQRSEQCPALTQLAHLVHKKQGERERLVYAKQGARHATVLFSCGKPPSAAQQDRVQLRAEQTVLLEDFLQNTLAGQIRALNAPQGPAALRHIHKLAQAHPGQPCTVGELSQLNRRLRKCLDASQASPTRRRARTWVAPSTNDSPRGPEPGSPRMRPMFQALQAPQQPGANAQGANRNSSWFRARCDEKLAPDSTGPTQQALRTLAERLASALDVPRQAPMLQDLPRKVLTEAARLGLLDDFLNVRDNLEPPLDRHTLTRLNSAQRRARQDA